MPAISFDRFYRYAELTSLLQSYAAEYPDLVRLESLGKSFEGRDIWLVVVTNSATGPDREKPALYVDGNIHAIEVSASAACLYYLNQLVTGYGKDEQITRLVDRRAVYLVPRVNPDGAEWALADQPRWIRSSTRPYPYDQDKLEGTLGYEDVDGDGKILMMRIPDPNGTWKPHPDDPRLMIRRDAVEVGGSYYRLVPESRVKNYDGHTLVINRPKQGLDLNRNFPSEWRPEGLQPGAGPYPASEPEVRALVDFFIQHNNISCATTFHTYSGVMLRPYGSKSDDELPVSDLWIYQKMGKLGTELSGYPNISIFHEFKYHPKQVITGTLEWAYEHLGMYVWVVELWSPMKQAGIKDFKYIDWSREHPLEDDLALMKWNDEVLGGKGFVPWYTFDHPDLGPIEMGGWDPMYWGNVPPSHLEKEIALFPAWLTWQGLITPELVLRSAEAEMIGPDTYRVRLVVDNAGWLATSTTEKAVERKSVRGVICEIELPEGAILKVGKERQEFGQLSGRAGKPASFDDTDDSTTDRLKVEWVVVVPPVRPLSQGVSVHITARHDRAGVVRAVINLDNS